jgi:hypothetical protein
MLEGREKSQKVYSADEEGKTAIDGMAYEKLQQNPMEGE